jgi:large subunit ribosomal protein L29
MMAKREEQLKEIRTKTTEQINDEVVELKGELTMLRIQKSARQDFKNSDFRNMRKTVYFLFRLLFWFC